MGPIAIVLLACAALLVVAVEWPRLSARLGLEGRAARRRARRKRTLTVVEGENDDFAASVERDLANLPVTREGDGRSRR